MMKRLSRIFHRQLCMRTGPTAFPGGYYSEPTGLQRFIKRLSS
jgi:hypothetical protein